MPSPWIIFLVLGEIISSKETVKILESRVVYIKYTNCIGKAANASTSVI